MDKVVDFATAKTKHDLAALNQKEEKTNRIKEAIKKLPGYRGDVPSKNTIRGLPDLKPGQIFWVEMDKKAYVVAALNGKKVTIKALDETASVSTNMTIYDMNKSIVSKEPLYDLEKDPDNLADRITVWFNEDCPPNTYYLLYGRDIHYVTLIKTPDGFATNLRTLAILSLWISIQRTALPVLRFGFAPEILMLNSSISCPTMPRSWYLSKNRHKKKNPSGFPEGSLLF